jgi:hypothetical protein
VSGADDRSPIPSARARALVRGAYDLHVHVGPDVVRRRIDDVALARRCAELGLAGFLLKSHYTSTAERAEVVRGVVPGVRALGAITLNRAVGGLNPLAVAIAAREGARVVWLPTVDAVNEATRPRKPGAKLPVWVQLQEELRATGVDIDPVPVLDSDGEVLPELRAVLRIVAAHDLVLATGHLGRDEIFAAVDAARDEGVREIVITHPDYPTQDLSADDQRALAERGALLERCFAPAYTGKVAWERMIEATRAVRAEHCLFATDLGQAANPAVEDGLALLADRFLDAGFSEEEVRTMAVVNTRRVAGAAALEEAAP